MATLNATIKPAHYPTSDIVRLFRTGLYSVDDTFQRRLVWTPKQKVRLIETIFMGYPMPDIYLHQLEADRDGRQEFSIVDGQQRINTIVQFVSGEWKIDQRYLDKSNKTAPYANLRWDQLPDAVKKEFWAYTINSRVIPPDVTKDEIKAIFRRLNESDKSLNPQELRHAEFSGKVIKFAERIADLEFWSDWEIFTTNNVRRMADVEMATSLISYCRNGIITDSPESINRLYDLFNETYPKETHDRKKIEDFLDYLDDIFQRDDNVARFYAKPIHIYTLLTVFDSNLKRQVVKLTNALANFVKLNEGNLQSAGNAKSILAAYRSGSVQRTRSKGSRQLRHDSLLAFLRLAGL